jgi:hypothetical protein
MDTTDRNQIIRPFGLEKSTLDDEAPKSIRKVQVVHLVYSMGKVCQRPGEISVFEWQHSNALVRVCDEN